MCDAAQFRKTLLYRYHRAIRRLPVHQIYPVGGIDSVVAGDRGSYVRNRRRPLVLVIKYLQLVQVAVAEKLATYSVLEPAKQQTLLSSVT